MRRVRFRRRGVSIYLTGTPWSDDFMRQYAAALDGVKAQASDVGADRTMPGSVDALVVSYYKLVFPTLKQSTQSERRYIIERFRAEYGYKPVRLLKREHIAAIISARLATPHAANNLLKTLHTLFEHAIAINVITSNPATDVRKFRIQTDGFRAWTESDVAQFVAHHPGWHQGTARVGHFNRNQLVKPRGEIGAPDLATRNVMLVFGADCNAHAHDVAATLSGKSKPECRC
jgi:hypothetical protein